MKNLATPRLWTQQETAQFLGITERKLFDLRRGGLIRAIKVGTCVRFHPEDVDRFIEVSRQQQGNN